MTPPWLPLVAELPSRADVIAAVEAAPGPIVEIIGAPGIGKTAVAGAVLARRGRGWRAMSALGCEDGDDFIRALGDAFHVLPVGDEGQVRARLRTLGDAVLFCDDVATDAVFAEVERLAADLPGLRILVAAEVARLPSPVHLGPVDIAPITDQFGELEGNPTLARLCAALSLPLDEAMARIQGAAAELVAWPMGLPGAPGRELPAAALRPDLKDRTILRRGVATRLDPGGDKLVRARMAPLLDVLAVDGHLPATPDVRDLLVLRRMARSGLDPMRTCAAAARLAALFGQRHVALAILGEGHPESPADGAVLMWARADVTLAGGDVAEAVRDAEEAARLYARAEDSAGQAALLRRTGDRLAARGEIERAEDAYGQARALYRRMAEPRGIAATQRGAADVALASGTSVGVGALHDEVTATLQTIPEPRLERANLRLGQAALATGRGELQRAAQVLQELVLDDAPPLLRANVARRRADMALRAGDLDLARREAEAATELYQQIGEVVAAAAALRVVGDALAAQGDCAAAVRRYTEALRLHVSARDLRGLMRTLEHAATVAEWAGDMDLARRWRSQRAEVVRVVD